MIKNLIIHRTISAGSSSLSSALIRRLCTAAVEKKVSAAAADGRLYNRLSALGSRKGVVAQTINEYIREGGVIRKFELDRCITELRRYGRYHQALEIMEWMERRKINFAFSDHAKHLDLICKVHGIAAAESFFSSLSPSAKNSMTYGALLNCYCTEKMTDKALSLFEKMNEMNMASTSLSFNNLMSMYLKLDQAEKVPSLVKQMKERNIQLSAFTYAIWMRSYSKLNDIEGVERVFQEVKQEGAKACDWTIYSTLAVAYVKAGLREKAELALRRLEEEMGPRNRKAFSYMISLYASIGNLGEVHRIWSAMKSSLRTVPNLSYLTMLQALDKLNDIDGIKKCFEEWESTCCNYDIRVANVAIRSYLRHNKANEAEAIFARALGKSSGPFFTAGEIFMEFYLENRQMKSTLQYMELEAILSRSSVSNWCPKPENINKFLSYCEEERDVDSAEDFCKYLRILNSLDQNVFKLLLQVYIAAGRTAPDMRTRAEKDGIEFSPELLNLLQNVCP